MRIRTRHVSTSTKPLIAAEIDLSEHYVGRHRSDLGPKPIPVADPPIEMLAAAEHPDRRPGIPVPAMTRDFLPPVAFNR